MSDAAPARREWSPQPAIVAVGWVLAVAALGWTVFGTAPTGRLLTAVLTVGLGLAALHGTLARPRLAADGQGVAVRGLVGARHWPWETVRVRVWRTRRLGREVALVELDGFDDDGDEQLVLLGRLDLGADPDDVVEVLHGLRP